ncbi:HEAT repeat domain-containing protein [Archangium lansingense]|uniref:HEAT repeat domain-containing protein n=1 Tax=Archangium lansingense TaxID=2995310 RepID=UPI003B75ECBE
MKSRKVLAASVLVVLAVLTVTYLFVRTPESVTGLVQEQRTRRFSYPRGQSWSYRLEYHADSRVRLSTVASGNGSEVGGKVDLVGRLVLRGLGQKGENWRVGLSLEPVQQHSLQVFGQELLPDEAAVRSLFHGREAMLEVGPEGDVLSVSFRPEDPSLYKNTVQTVLGELQVVLRQGEQWAVSESTARGRARAEYRLLEEDGDRVRVSRSRVGYEQLVGLGQGGTVRVGSSWEAAVEGGVLERLEGEERVERLGEDGRPAGHMRFALKVVRESETAFDTAAVATLEQGAQEKLPPGRLVVDPLARKKMLDQQVAGLTAEQLMAVLRASVNGGVFPDHNHFLLQATGLLEREPELCAKLVELFGQPGTDVRGRAVLLDLLAGAGTPEAQAAMLEALSTPQARGDEQYHMLLSRLALVQEPTEATVDFARREYEKSQGAVHTASTYVLGATAGALHRNGGADQARAAVQRLVEDLRASDASEQQMHLLLGLGNAGVAEHTPLIASYAQSSSEEVRRAAAKALRKVPSEQSQQVLLGLVGDEASRVQVTALDTLTRFKLEPQALVQLRDEVLNGQLDPQSYGSLVTLVEPYLAQEPAVRDVLEYLLTQDKTERSLRTRIHNLLET